MTWVRSHLVCSFVRGHSTSQLELNNERKGTRYLRTSDLLDDLAFRKTDELYCQDLPPRPVMKDEREIVLTIEGFLRPGGRTTVGVPCWKGEGLLNNHVVKFESKSPILDTRFARYAHAIKSVGEVTVQYAVGAIAVSSGRALSEWAIPLPPLDEQRRIADFLDAETARIDALIAKKRRMIESLAERLTARIDRGFASMSRGERPLRRFLAAPPDYGATESGDVDHDEWPRYIRITDIRDDGSLKIDGRRFIDPIIARPYMLRDGDLLVARSGATVGKSFAYQRHMGPCAFAGYMIRLRPDSRMICSGLLKYWLRSSGYWMQINRESVQATIENVSAEKYASFMIPVVPRHFQESLVTELEREHSYAQRIMSVLDRQIELLQERRQALITHVVTDQLPIPA